MVNHVDTRPLFILALDGIPRRGGNIRVDEHLVLRL